MSDVMDLSKVDEALGKAEECLLKEKEKEGIVTADVAKKSSENHGLLAASCSAESTKDEDEKKEVKELKKVIDMQRKKINELHTKVWKTSDSKGELEKKVQKQESELKKLRRSTGQSAKGFRPTQPRRNQPSLKDANTQTEKKIHADETAVEVVELNETIKAQQKIICQHAQKNNELRNKLWRAKDNLANAKRNKRAPVKYIQHSSCQTEENYFKEKKENDIFIENLIMTIENEQAKFNIVNRLNVDINREKKEELSTLQLLSKQNEDMQEKRISFLRGKLVNQVKDNFTARAGCLEAIQELKMKDIENCELKRALQEKSAALEAFTKENDALKCEVANLRQELQTQKERDEMGTSLTQAGNPNLRHMESLTPTQH